MNGAELFVKCLENEGVEYIFGIPGEENLAFLEALRKSDIRLIVTRHEQAAGFMAATYGRLTGKPGVCLSTLGHGATNFVTSVSYALLGGMPVLFITGQKPIKKSKQGLFQIIDRKCNHYSFPRTRGFSNRDRRKTRTRPFRTSRGYRRRTNRWKALCCNCSAPSHS